jgi:xylono-1,5-lactonase
MNPGESAAQSHWLGGVVSQMPAPVYGAPRCLDAAGAQLGEGLLWSAREQCLYWVDILARRLFRCNLMSGERTQWTFEEEVSAVAERTGGRPGLVLTLRQGFALFDPASGEPPRYLCKPEPELPCNRFNDGKCDAQGRFWAGTMDFACEAPTGSLYRFDPDGQCTRHEQGIAVTNGPTWAQVDGQLCLFLNDTVNGRIYQYRCDPQSGELSDKRLWKTFAPDEGVPDGMTTDALGRLWIAHWGGARVSCHDPASGACLARIDLPTSHVTNCAFGGADLCTLFITTARQGLSDDQLAREPLAGGLFAVAVDSPGLPANGFGG